MYISTVNKCPYGRGVPGGFTWSMLRHTWMLRRVDGLMFMKTCKYGRCYRFFGVGVGWGGVMITFLKLANMVDCYARCWVGWGWWWSRSLNLPTWLIATQDVGLGGVGDDHVPWTCPRGWCYARSWVGWGGVGWWSRSLNLPTWLMLRKMLGGVGWVMITFLELAHVVDATQEVEWGGVGWGDDHVPWTCQHGWCYARCWVGWGGWWPRSLNLPTWLMLRKKLGGWDFSHFLNKASCKHCGATKWNAFLAWCLWQMLSKKPLRQLWHRCPKKKRLTVMLSGPQIHCKNNGKSFLLTGAIK